MYYRDKFDKTYYYKKVGEKGIFTILKSVQVANGREELGKGEIWCVPSHLRDLYEQCEAPI